jgi:hypothetical protein
LLRAAPRQARSQKQLGCTQRPAARSPTHLAHERLPRRQLPCCGHNRKRLLHAPGKAERRVANVGDGQLLQAGLAHRHTPKVQAAGWQLQLAGWQHCGQRHVNAGGARQHLELLAKLLAGERAKQHLRSSCVRGRGARRRQLALQQQSAARRQASTAHATIEQQPARSATVRALMVADMPGLSRRGSGNSTLKGLPCGSSL